MPNDSRPRNSSFFSTKISSSETESTTLSSPLDNFSKRISYITDIEGDGAYFDRYIEVSKILKFESVTPNFDETNPLEFFPYTKHVVFLENSSTNSNVDKTMLVCGGDVWDKGGGDLYVVRQLLSMHDRYGDQRVHFIVGNRDINKMRILQEIGMCGNLDDNNLPTHHGVFWLKGTGRTGDPDLRDVLEHSSTSESVISKNSGRVSSCAAERLTWVLQQTMGCPDGLKPRRGELEREKLACARANRERKTDDCEIDYAVTDEEVVQSYRTSCHPIFGVMGQYIRRGKLAKKIGGVLFVHGSIPVSSAILTKYKTYSNELDAISSMTSCAPGTKSIQQIKGSFWAEFFEDMMPWLRSSTETEPGKSGPEVSSTYHFSTKPRTVTSVFQRIFCCGLSELKLSINYKRRRSNKQGVMHTNQKTRPSHDVTMEVQNIKKRRKKCPGKHRNSDKTTTLTSEESHIENLFEDEEDNQLRRRENRHGETPVRNIDEWIVKIDEFYNKHSEAWAQYVTDEPSGDYCWSRYGGYDSKVGAIMQYGLGFLPKNDINPTVIYSSWMTNGMPQILSRDSEEDVLRAKLLGEFFIESGLDLIVTGHQPIGDSPLTIQVANEYRDKCKFIIIGDTSYSGDTIWEGSDGKRQNIGRGKAISGRGDVAVSEILIDIAALGSVISATYHGRLSDGQDYESCNIFNERQDSSLLGKLLDEKVLVVEGLEDNDQTDWIVKAKLSDGFFLVSSGKGHKVFNAIAKSRGKIASFVSSFTSTKIPLCLENC